MDQRRPTTVLIAGCGDLGTEAGLRFLALGHRVVGVRRRAELLPDGLERQPVDLAVDVPVVPGDVGVIVVPLTPGARTAEAYRRTYVDGLRHVLDGVPHGASPRIVFVSSTAVWGAPVDGVVDERTPVSPATDTAVVLLEAERLASASPYEVCLLRLGGVYGPGRERLIDQVRSGAARVPNAPAMTNRIHRDDAARAIVHLALREEPMPPVVIGVDDEPAELGDVLRFIARELDLPDPPVGDAAPRSAPSRRLSSALLRSTGFEPTYPTYREGYRAVLAGAGSRHP